MTTSPAAGCLIGLALGDALGAPVEFMPIERIRQVFPPNGPQTPKGDPVLVTDDTQMAVAVGEALIHCGVPPTPANCESALRDAFVTWFKSPENTRAPGRTCLTACDRLASGTRWFDASVRGSKGCGANMRVAPVALFCRAHNLDDSICAALAQFQAALTHGHATGLAAADLTTFAIRQLSERCDPSTLVARLRMYAESQRTVYHADWLGPVWQRPMITSAEMFIAQGWDDCLSILDRLSDAVVKADRETDPCEQTGQGWIAEEALATALLCFLLYPSDPIAALRRAALTSGDSDSIACITGAFAGAYHGLNAWPEDWVQRVEYHDRLMTLAHAWDH